MAIHREEFEGSSLASAQKQAENAARPAGRHLWHGEVLEDGRTARVRLTIEELPDTGFCQVCGTEDARFAQTVPHRLKALIPVDVRLDAIGNESHPEVFESDAWQLSGSDADRVRLKPRGFYACSVSCEDVVYGTEAVLLLEELPGLASVAYLTGEWGKRKTEDYKAALHAAAESILASLPARRPAWYCWACGKPLEHGIERGHPRCPECGHSQSILVMAAREAQWERPHAGTAPERDGEPAGAALRHVAQAAGPRKQRQSRVQTVATLLLVQGMLELMMGSVFLSITHDAAEGKDAAAVLAALGIGCGLLKALAGVVNLRRRGRRLGIAALASGIASSCTVVCAPTAIALAIWGLTVYWPHDAFAADPTRTASA